ncbi:hypothetical protein [Paenibacillus tianjinensis]|uniref:Uncharacterized protein n=1 Tax=Paenibacillus tianjinensis TaxID=2810347 RepID=A0ABX7L9U6_9BACL|nr:hypothetical protein [Paenibacillus tianjinensis]QSF43499.1 hypothetical protein JRJ22_19750 [Paenibacillus tianjinensis]
MNLAKMTREDLEVAIIENDIVDVMELDDDISTEELRSIVQKWVEGGDECSDC